MVHAIMTAFVFIAAFALICRGTMDRLTAILVAAGVISLYGFAAGFFSAEMVIDSIYFETLALIFGMSVISATLARAGLFSLLSARMAVQAKGNGWWVLVFLSLVTYGLSLLVNNLATMVVLLPVTLNLCRQMGLNPVPVLIAEIMASNLGGASTMVGDFPNMIIASAGSLHFFDFVGGMMVPCLILFAAMLTYFQWRRAEIGESRTQIATVRSDAPDQTVDPSLTKLGLAILALALVGFMFSDALDLRPGWVALAAGFLALLLGGSEIEDWFAACGGRDILFFAGLFVMVGGLVAAGALDAFVWAIDGLGAGGELWSVLALMWIAAVSTIFLNAGAATAFFVPIAASLNATGGDHAVWWALSLGVLAGSSAALTGATAGPLAASHLDNFMVRHPEMRTLVSDGKGLDFKAYLSWGLPIMVIFLSLSSIYVTVLVG